MDFKKLAIFVIIIGVLAIGYGGIQWISNQPKEFQRTGNFQRDSNTNFRINVANLAGLSKQEDAKKIMIAGGIVFIIGIGIFVSLKKSK